MCTWIHWKSNCIWLLTVTWSPTFAFPIFEKCDVNPVSNSLIILQYLLLVLSTNFEIFDSLSTSFSLRYQQQHTGTEAKYLIINWQIRYKGAWLALHESKQPETMQIPIHFVFHMHGNLLTLSHISKDNRTALTWKYVCVCMFHLGINSSRIFVL